MAVTISVVSQVGTPYYTVRFAHRTTQLRGFQTHRTAYTTRGNTTRTYYHAANRIRTRGPTS
jgi:hypothetical protein